MSLPHISEAYKSCPVCRSDMKGDRNSKRCISEACGFTNYFNPKLNISILILRGQGEILLSERKQEPRSGGLQIVGGFQKQGETIEQSCRRIVRAELGDDIQLDFEDATLFFDCPQTYESGGYEYDLICLYYSVLWSGGAAKETEFCGQSTWFTTPDIPSERIDFESDRRALNTYLR